MIRSLRRKFILSAMAAFSILLLILIAGVTAVGYVRIERHMNEFMQQLIDHPQTSAFSGSETSRHKRPLENPIAYYDISIDSTGEILRIDEKGVWEPDHEAARSYAAQILSTGKTEGKIPGYKFRLLQNADGGARLILLESADQLHTVRDMLQIAFSICALCLLLLFFILLPISTRAVRSYALHIEKQKQFITNAGHELKTPAAIIRSNIDAMELIQGESKWSRNIRSQSDRLNLLLQRLLFMARLDERSVLPSTETLDLSALLRAELETYESILAERKLCLTTRLPSNLTFKGSREYLCQLIHILMDNATQYASVGSEIDVLLEGKRRKVRMLFVNTVSALPPCPPEALFDRFYRGDSARTQAGGGYGVGLSAARAIAEMHRGTISAAYESETLIRFTVDLPK